MTSDIYFPYIQWVETQFPSMLQLVKKLCNINTHSENLEGLSKMLLELKVAFKALGGTLEEVSLPPYTKINDLGEEEKIQIGKALLITKRPQAKVQIFFCGHMDTVYQKNFEVEQVGEKILKGPGVADMKGGLVVLLKAVEALEKTPFANNIGWRILITPDEEIGSPSSTPLIEHACRGYPIGLVFEPALSDGSIVTMRKGSSNYTVIVKGKSAHAGRNIEEGRNAISALSYFLGRIQYEQKKLGSMTLNVGFIVGGSASNVVPDHALSRLNIRGDSLEEMQLFFEIIEEQKKIVEKEKEVKIQIICESKREPKPKDLRFDALFKEIKAIGKTLGISMEGKPSGGVCDGNTLFACGTSNIDTMGPVGGSLHSNEEYLEIDSLKERTKLVALFLMSVANGEISV